jgi:hypothetical protein
MSEKYEQTELYKKLRVNVNYAHYYERFASLIGSSQHDEEILALLVQIIEIQKDCVYKVILIAGNAILTDYHVKVLKCLYGDKLESYHYKDLGTVKLEKFRKYLLVIDLDANLPFPPNLISNLHDKIRHSMEKTEKLRCIYLAHSYRNLEYAVRVRSTDRYFVFDESAHQETLKANPESKIYKCYYHEN